MSTSALAAASPSSASALLVKGAPTGGTGHGRSGRCPLIHGPAVLDGLLAEIGLSDRAALDLALDLRTALQARADAATCVDLLCRLRAQLAGRHYLAFFRVRRWLQSVLATETRAGRGEPWVRSPLPLDCARPDEACHQCLARIFAGADALPALAQVRFVFTA